MSAEKERRRAFIEKNGYDPNYPLSERTPQPHTITRPPRRKTGTVIFFEEERGFGFILPDRGSNGKSRNVFFAGKHLPAPVAPPIGTRVRYHVTYDLQERANAVDIELIVPTPADEFLQQQLDSYK